MAAEAGAAQYPGQWEVGPGGPASCLLDGEAKESQVRKLASPPPAPHLHDYRSSILLFALLSQAGRTCLALITQFRLEKGMAAHSSILAWEMPWTEEPGGLVHGVTKSRTQLSD